MKVKWLLLVFLIAVADSLSSQALYSSTTEIGSRYNFGTGNAGTPKVGFDDISIPNYQVEGKDSVIVTKVNIGIRRSANAPATDVSIYYTPVDNTSQLNTFIKIPPVLLGTVSLATNGSSPITTVVSVGDAVSTLFKMKTDTNAVYPGYHTFFIGTALSNPDPANAIRFTSGPPINANNVWIYDADSSVARYAAQFDHIVATLYTEVFGESQSLLPITLSLFRGETTANNNVLTWTTATELNSKGFELLRSADGVNFSSISLVNSKAIKGSSTVPLTYQYRDQNPVNGNNYYRLKQVSIDGRFILSATVMLKNDKQASLRFTNVYPNPAKSILNLSLNSLVGGDIHIAITDLNGKIQMQKYGKTVRGVNNLSLNVSKLSAGSYIIKASADSSGVSVVEKFIKQ